MTSVFREHTRTAGEPLTCTVESVFPFGAFVLLPDGTRAYIRRRELTLSGNKDPREVVIVGQQLQAVPIVQDATDRTPELSVRATLRDPWPQFAIQYRVGDVVAATVKALYPRGIKVEIMPGVDGQIPARDLEPACQALELKDFLWPDDRIEAVITTMDSSRRFLGLSMRRRLEQLTLIESVREQLDRVAQIPQAESASESNADSDLLSGRGSIELQGPLLIVEDRDEIRIPLLTWLRERGCQAMGVASAREAMESCDRHDFAIGIFDLDIPGINGVSLIQTLRELHNAMPVAVMSGPDLIVDQWPLLQPLGIVACFPKPLDLDEIAQTLQRIGRGDTTPLVRDWVEEDTASQVTAFQNLATDLRSSRLPAHRLSTILEQLLGDTGADRGFIFRQDPESKSVSIIASAGSQPLNKDAMYRLPDSPVKDVIRESAVIIMGEASSDDTGRLRNLVPLLSFESVIGIPLSAGGHTEHALFLFARRPNAFRQLAIQQALNTAALLQAVLQSQLLEQRLESASGIMLSGQLSSAFGHEVYNKVTSLDLQMKNLAYSLDGPAACASEVVALAGLRESVDEALRTVTELRGIVADFQRLMRNTDEQRVDVKQALESAIAQVRLIALRQDTRIYLETAPGLPLAQGNSIRMQHVFLNLFLNALQHMAALDSHRRILRVSACISPGASRPQVQIRFSDLGPGIHQQLWERIFALGFTTREGGSGLGLFIARSLVESVGGRLTVEESLISMGSTFLIELPVAA